MVKKIAYVTDIHLDEEFPTQYKIDTRRNWLTVLEDISSRNINEVIIGGDIGEITSHDWFFTSLKNFNFNVTLGNHDRYEEIIKYFNSGVSKKPKLYYLKEKCGFVCIFLDSSYALIDDEQIDWLEKQLSTSKKILIFIHHPILSVDIEVDKRYPLKGRKRIESIILESKKEVVVFCGHYHCHDEKTQDNICQYITPAVSYQAIKKFDEIEIDNGTFGYSIINFWENKVSTDLILFT